MINTDATLTTERPTGYTAADQLSEQHFNDSFAPQETGGETSFGALLAVVTGSGSFQSKGQANHHLRLHFDARALHHQEQVRYQLLNRTA